MKVLVIGGTGFLGAPVVRRLLAHGHEVAVYNRQQTQTTLPDAVRRICCPDSQLPIRTFVPEVHEFQADIIIHTMAMGEPDSLAARKAFSGRAERLVLISSGDVYQEYGRLKTLEFGPPAGAPLAEDAPLRTVLFPYRTAIGSQNALEYWYEKILAERVALGDPHLPGTVLRLPKLFGPGNNQDLGTVYLYQNYPNWRWTHGFVFDVAEAVAVAATHPAALGQVFNLGESETPTVAERLAWLPPSKIRTGGFPHMDFNHNIEMDTRRVRQMLGYRDLVPEREAMLKTLAGEFDEMFS
jgi:nucleoside-diphosphate-sugar epimerase